MAEYIEREATVLQLLEKGQTSRRYKLGDVWELNFDEIREAIASIPSADVRPVVLGKWKHRKDSAWCGGGRTECSACGFGYSDEYYHEVDEFNFCPNCGARMEES